MAFYDYDLTEQVKGKHELSKIEEVVGFSGLVYRFKDLANSVGRQGYGVEVGIKALYLQFHYDLSDRELEERLRFDLAFKWFCGFTAFGETPDHRFFGRFRKAMGTKRIGVLFKAINRRAEENGLLKKTFRFADATAIETKQTTWEERDKALANGEEALNNQNWTGAADYRSAVWMQREVQILVRLQRACLCRYGIDADREYRRNASQYFRPSRLCAGLPEVRGKGLCGQSVLSQACTNGHEKEGRT